MKNHFFNCSQTSLLIENCSTAVSDFIHRMTEESDFNEESEKTDCLYCFIWILLGGLIIGVGLAVILTIYIDKRSKP